MHRLLLIVKSAAGLFLIGSGSSFIFTSSASLSPMVEQSLGKKSGTTTCLPSNVALGL